MIGTCHFCEKPAELQLSHIVPKSLFKGLKGPKGHLIGVHGQGQHGAAPLQDGLKQHLFCAPCEQYFSAKFERPYNRFSRIHGPLPDPWRGLEVRIRFDYAPFKLFHLLNLYRAGVSTLSSYRHVELGPHLTELRRMLREFDAGPAEQYQVQGAAVLEKDGRLARVVTIPQKHRYDSRIAWATVYGGVSWMVAVSGGFPPNMKRAALQDDGSMKFQAFQLKDFTIMHKAAKLLNS